MFAVIDNFSISRYYVHGVSFPAPFWCGLLSIAIAAERKILSQEFQRPRSLSHVIRDKIEKQIKGGIYNDENHRLKCAGIWG